MIGIFDSGVGGLSVWKELVKLLPGQEYLYVSDSGYCPYGPKPKSYVVERAKKISDFLIKQGADIIVVACNTATAGAIETLRASFSIPFVGMEPAVKPAALQSKSGVIGVLATQGTFRGELYLRTLHKFAANTKVMEQIGDGLVELVEAGKTDSTEANILLKKYLDPILKEGADYLVLGCTHYPFLTETIKRITGDRLTIVNPAPAVAKRVQEVLETLSTKVGDADCPSRFYTTGQNWELLQRMAEEIVCQVEAEEERGLPLRKREYNTKDI